MNRFTSALCATLLVTSIAACDKGVLSAPEISSPIGISKSSTVCTSGCTSNYNGLGPGGDTISMAIGGDAIVAPLSGLPNVIIKKVFPLDPMIGVAAIRLDDSHIDISASVHACESPFPPRHCMVKVTYTAGPPVGMGNKTDTIVVKLSMPPMITIQIPIDTVWITASDSAIVEPLSGDSTLVIRSVNPIKGIFTSLVDSTHISIAVGHVCAFDAPQPICAMLRVIYLAGPAGNKFAIDTGTVIVGVLRPPPPPPTIQNIDIPVGYTSWAPMLVPASQFATDVTGTPLTVTAATAQTAVPGLTVSVVNGQLAVTRILSVFPSSGLSVPVSVTVSDGTTSATGVITLKLQ